MPPSASQANHEKILEKEVSWSAVNGTKADLWEASGRAMLEALIQGEQDSHRLAEMSQGKLRNKIPGLQEDLQERGNEYHRFLPRELMDHLYFVQSQVQRIEQEVARLCTNPGVGPRDRMGIASRDRAEHEAVPRCAAPGGLGRARSGQLRRKAQERQDPQRESMVAPRSKTICRLSIAGWQREEDRNARPLQRPQAPGHCLLYLASRNLLPRARRSLFRSPEPRRSHAGA
jgi:hypothetical protein